MASPLYPGYYPGKPVYRDRRPWNKPQDTPMDSFEATINEIGEKVYESPLNFPRWLVEQELTDIKNALKIYTPSKDPLAKATPTDESDEADLAQAEAAHGPEDMEEIPGATVSLSLSYKDLFENPIGSLKKSLVDLPVKSILEPDDYATKARAALWNEIIKQNTPNNPYNMVLRDDSAIQSISTENNTRKNVAGGYKAFAESVAGDDAFIVNSATAIFRAGKFEKVNKSLHSSIAGELSAHINSGRIDRETLTSDQNAYIDKILSRNTFFNTYDKGGSDANFGLKDSFNFLTKKLEIENGVPFSFISESDKQDFSKKIRTGFDSTSTVAVAQELNNSLNSTLNSINMLNDGDKKRAKSFNDHLNRLKSDLGTYVQLDAQGNITSITDELGLLKFLNKESKKFSRTTFDGGYFGNLSRKMAFDISRDQGLKDFFSKLETEDGERVMSSASVGSLNLASRMHDEWGANTFADLLTDISGGKIPTQFLWQRWIKPKIERYTPSYWIGRGKTYFMENTKLGMQIGSAMFKYESYLTSLQSGFVGKLVLGGQKNWELVKEKLADAISKVLVTAFNIATEGVGKVFDWLLKVVVKFVVNKVIDFTQKVWRSLVKLDFEAIEEMFFKAGKALLPIVVGCLAPFVMMFVFIMFIIVIFVGVLPREDATKEPAPIGDFIVTPLPWFGGFNEQNCPLNDVLSLSFPNSSSNNAAVEAYNLVSSLRRGFWCYWNHHPNYDDSADDRDLFDEITFQYNAFPAALNECADCLFWCTWLPYVAYENIGQPFDTSISYLGAQRMNEEFKNNRTYITPDTPGACDAVTDGDIVFWNVSEGTGWHVSMVYKVQSKTVYTVHSNAPYKELPLICNSDGTIQDPPGGTMSVVGFGRPEGGGSSSSSGPGGTSSSGGSGGTFTGGSGGVILN